jgi:hypothetical protein
MVYRLSGALNQLLNYRRGGRNVRIADAKVDQIDPPGQRGALAAVDLSEEVRW